MQESTPPTNENWVGTKRAAEISGYSRVHIRRLVHLGLVQACRPGGRDILIQVASLQRYMQRMAELGTQRHNAWREELIQQGRGRTHLEPQNEGG